MYAGEAQFRAFSQGRLFNPSALLAVEPAPGNVSAAEPGCFIPCGRLDFRPGCSYSQIAAPLLPITRR
jgi:hypothetical protein